MLLKWEEELLGVGEEEQYPQKHKPQSNVAELLGNERVELDKDKVSIAAMRDEGR
jgi:hypothetical protein